MTNAHRAAMLLCGAALVCADGGTSSSVAGGTVPGWPDYIAMGAVGGPNVTPPTATSTGGDDDFGGRPVDVVFKYAGVNGNGDPGIIDPPTNALRMTNDLTILSTINSHPMRVAIVEYTAQMSGGFSLTDFSNLPEPTPSQPAGSYIMARHFIGLASDAIVLNDRPVAYQASNYFGSLILNPDLLGVIQQGGAISNVNGALPANSVNTAVDQAMCFLTASRSYLNTSNPNGVGTAPYLNKTYTGTPVVILESLLADGYPVWSINGQTDPYWNTAIDNLIGGTGSTYSRVGQWFNACVANPTYDKTAYQRPNFPAGFEGWVQANNWLIRTFSPTGNVTFGWQDNMWAAGSGFWLHNDLMDSGIASAYSTPVSSFLQQNAPSTVGPGALGAAYVPKFFVFDRYETDDSTAPDQATLYNARSWDNYLTAVGQVSRNFGNIPVMLWQIPGSHIPYVGEANPELYNNTSGLYVFSTAPVYFFADSGLQSDLGNIIAGAGTSTNSAVGNYLPNCGAGAYNCSTGSNYRQYLLAYQGQPNNFNWGKDNRKLAKAAANNVFAILWGGGNTTNVIKNFSNTDDHGWLAGKIIAYYKNPTPLTAPVATHDFNGDTKSDIAWRDTSGNTEIWEMNGTTVINQNSSLVANVAGQWAIVGQRDFNGDGYADLLWRDTSGNVAIWEMNGTTVLNANSSFVGNMPTNWSIVGTGDFNGDGRGDLLWQDMSGNVAIWEMNGTTVLNANSSFVGNVAGQWSIKGTGDFNGDGMSDILWQDTSGNVAIWEMNGTSILNQNASFVANVPSQWSTKGTGDFNGDGMSDILWQDTFGNVAIWEMNGTTVLNQSNSFVANVPGQWSIQLTGDFNGDGKSDILWQDTSGNVAIWEMNGIAVLNRNSSFVANVAGQWAIQHLAAE
jgi:hypothetical protein